MSNKKIHPIKEEDGVVILPLKDYQELKKKAAPTYYLEGEKAEKVDALVEEGIKQHQEGETEEIDSFSDF